MFTVAGPRHRSWRMFYERAYDLRLGISQRRVGLEPQSWTTIGEARGGEEGQPDVSQTRG